MATTKDSARYNEGKTLESSGRKDGNEKGSNGRKGKEKELVDREKVLAWKVEGLYSGKEQETFKDEGNQSVTKWGLSNVVRKLMGRGMNWEDAWEEEEGLIVREMDRRMVAAEWSMGEEALVKERRVTGSESTTFAWVSNNSIAPWLSQIEPFSSYSDWAKCNLDQNTKSAWVRTHYKCVAQKVNHVPMWDGRIPDPGLNWRGWAIARAVPMPGPADEWFMLKFSHRARGGRLTPERSLELLIGRILRPLNKEALLAIL